MEKELEQQPDTSLYHPQYAKYIRVGQSNRVGVWEEMIDCYEGERAIKEKGIEYLPPTDAQQRGVGVASFDVQLEKAQVYPSDAFAISAYNNYRARAVFPDWVADTAKAMCGMLCKVPPTLQLPERLAVMKERFSVDLRNMQTVIYEILERQVLTGRVGVLLDVPEELGNKVVPYAAVYYENRIINWHIGNNNGFEVPDFVLLDESGNWFNPETFSYQWRTRYRVCALDGNGEYYTATFDGQMPRFSYRRPPNGAVYPSIAGKRLRTLPFVIINAVDNKFDIAKPPLLGVADLALSAYRLSADHRQGLFLTGQPTIVGTGIEPDTPLVIGSQKGIALPQGASVNFLEISGSGLAQMSAEFANLKEEARRKGVELVEGGGESGVALNTRVTIKTASLVSIANACEAGITQLLKIAAEWCNVTLGNDELQIVLNKDFKDDSADGTEVIQFAGLVQSGDFTRRDYHQMLVDRDLTRFKNYEEWENQCDRPTESQTDIAEYEPEAV